MIFIEKPTFSRLKTVFLSTADRFDIQQFCVLNVEHSVIVCSLIILINTADGGRQV